MATFTQVFSGNTVFPSDQTYTSQNLTGNLVLTWPVEVGSTSNIATTIINVTQSGAGFKIAVPAANLASTGKSILFNNTGSYSFTVTDTSGNTIIAVSPGQAWQIYLTDNSTANGIWSYFQQGSGTSVAQASSLIGYGIIASGQSLNQSMPVTQINSAYTLGAADRASVVVWTGGSGTVTLSSAATVGANWFANIKNAGAGTLTIALTSGDTIDGVSTITLSSQDSLIVLSNGTTYYTIGRTRLNNLAYTFLAIAVNASGTQTLSSAQYSNQILRFSGSLTGNLTVVFPTTIQQWDIDNQVTLNGFTLSLATAAGTPISVSAASRIIIFGDGTNVLNASPSSVTFPISVAQGGTNATTSGGALTNLGGTSVGISLFTTASAAAARLSLLVDQRTAVADTNYTGLVTDRLIAYTSITASRILTLPAANGFNPGETIIVVDESGAVSPIITLTVACAGADTLNGLANTILTIPYSYLTLESNGTNKWFVVSIVSSTTSTFSAGTSTGAANAQIVAAPTPAGFTLTRGNRLSFIAGFTNTAAATLAVNGLAATNIFVPGAAGPTALVGGEIAVGNLVEVIYDGTQFELISAPGKVAANTVVAGSIAAGAATLVKLDTTGALSTVLTGQGAGVAPAWVASSSALSFRNRIINGDFRIAQRGASGTVTAAGYMLDRFLSNFTGTAPTWQQTTSTTTGLSQLESILQITGIAANTGINIEQRIESQNCRDMAGQTCMLTYYVFQSTGSTMSVTSTLSYANTVDNFGAITAIGTSGATSVTTGTWTKVTSTFAIPNAATTGLKIQLVSNNPAIVATQLLQIAGVQFEVGASSTSFERRPIAYELELCQRYYSTGGNFLQTSVTSGFAYSATMILPTVMRATPTFVMTNAGQVSFPFTPGTPVQVSPQYWYEVRTANTTASGQFATTWTASAEI